MSGWRTIAAMLALALTAGQARAEDGLHGMVQISLGGGDTEESWLDRGFGKTSWSGTEARLSQAVVEWRPSFGFSTSAVVSLQHQAGVRHATWEVSTTD